MVIAHARELERGRALLSGAGSSIEENQSIPRAARSATVQTSPSGALLRWGMSPKLLVVFFCFGLLISALCGALWGGLGFALCMSVIIIRCKRQAALRTEAFERDYPALLLALASAVRTGLDPLMALMSTSDLFEEKSVMRGELRSVKSALERGATEEEAIHRFGTTVRHPDLQLFRTAFVLARREGASLSECLRRLVRVTRNRQSFRRKVKAAVALQKLSAVGIGGCAVAIGVIQGISNPQALSLAMEHPTGSKLILTGIAAIFIGIVWMLRISGSHR